MRSQIHSVPTPPPPCPANNKLLRKYGPNRSVRWTRRSVLNYCGTQTRDLINYVPKKCPNRSVRWTRHSLGMRGGGRRSLDTGAAFTSVWGGKVSPVCKSFFAHVADDGGLHCRSQGEAELGGGGACGQCTVEGSEGYLWFSGIQTVGGTRRGPWSIGQALRAWVSSRPLTDVGDRRVGHGGPGHGGGTRGQASDGGGARVVQRGTCKAKVWGHGARPSPGYSAVVVRRGG